MQKRILIALLIAVGVLSSCGVFRNRGVSYYYAGEPVEESGYQPLGKVVEAWYPCSVKGPAQRRMIVYLPPDYEEGTKRYPVVYLLHGARGHETVWIQRGRMFQITDSLYCQGNSVPAIVVMPNVNQYRDDKDFENSRYKDAMESLFEIDGTVETAFVRDVVDYVDSHFRTIPDKAHRAICGLSVGALQSMYISADSPQTFDYIGLFSPFWKIITHPGPDNLFYFNVKKKWKQQFSPNPPKGYYVMTSGGDFFYLHVQNLRRYFDRHGYPYTYIRTRGGHEWYNWSYYYAWMMEHVFQESAK